MAAATSLTMTVTLATVVPAHGKGPLGISELARPDAASALAAARQSGQRVAITNMATERAEYFATPDGHVTGIISTEAVRFRRDGAWVPVDLTLRRMADGSVAPVAHPDSLRMSGARSAASGDLASLGTGAERVAMGWNGALPEPDLDGSKATYAEVFPGVDLVVQATSTGFEQFAVVKSATAAARYVKEISLPISGAGVRAATEDKRGQIRVRDANGRQVADIPTPMMWDARSDGRNRPPVPRQIAVDVTSTAPTSGRAAGVMLNLKPDQKWLADRNTVYPVTIDPEVDRLTTINSTTVVKNYPYGWPDADSLFLGTYDDTLSFRSFVSWDTTALRGSYVKSATAHFTNPWSSTCESVPWELWTTGSISADTAWDNQPQWLHQESTSTETSCYDTTVTAEATSFFRRAATDNVSTATMGLRATDETDYSQYKQFWSRNYTDASRVPFVEVSFTFDVTASNPSIDEGSSCVSGEDRPTTDNITPALHVEINAPAGAQAHAEFELTQLGGEALFTSTSAPQASGTVFTAVVPAGKLADGGLYRWRTRGATGGSSGPWTAWCEFTVNKGVVIVAADDVNEPVPEDLRDALGVYDELAEGNPEEFGYATVEGSAVVVDVVTAAGEQKAEALENGTLEPDPTSGSDPEENTAEEAAILGQEKVEGVEMDTAITTVSRAETERLREQLHNAVENNASLASADIWMTEVDRETGRVAVTMTDITSPAAQALEEMFGDKVQLVREANPESEAETGRLADESPFTGGARIKFPGLSGKCTNAFSWKIDASRSGMLTAGHCAAVSGQAVQTNSGDALGSIMSENYGPRGTEYLPQQKVYRGDMSLIRVPSGKIYPYIYRGVSSSSARYTVRAMWHRRAQPGDQYCTGGSYGGEICGWKVKSTGATVNSDGKWLRNVVVSEKKKGWCTRPGDSGGPVYTVNSDGSVVAKGIHHGSNGGGGDDHYAGALDKCLEIFTDIRDAYFGFPGHLETR
ncbi:hypothetical protein I4J89_48735 [Actinoplanes sp. NEAU-A11]|uniref:Serine protease n=1 Tax=Actinoplanes aureus TaxID=2792083 RepID=A0A931G2P5_9ACTN|nr:hypothetical protein [Actinoplanes aureus]